MRVSIVKSGTGNKNICRIVKVEEANRDEEKDAVLLLVVIKKRLCRFFP